MKDKRTADTFKENNYICEEVLLMMNKFWRDNKVMKDFRIAGNKFGSTIILRFTDQEYDMHESTPHYMLPKSNSTRQRDFSRLQERAYRPPTSSPRDMGVLMPRLLPKGLKVVSERKKCADFKNASLMRRNLEESCQN